VLIEIEAELLVLDAEKGTDFGPELRGSSIPALRRPREMGRPVTIAVNGKTHQVTDDRAFDRLLDLLDRIEAIDGIREGLESLTRGESRPVEEFFDEMERESQAARRA
jgi:hypothetical protein